MFTTIGRHWGKSECAPPELTDLQNELATGILMGDAWVRKQEHRTNPGLMLTMTNESFVSWIADQFDPIANEVSMTRSAEKSAEYIDAEPEDCGDQYTVRMTHEEFDEFYQWYASGEKVFPNIDLTPTIAKMWYVCDGGLVWPGDGSNGAAAVITASNESERLRDLANWFADAGVPRPDVVPGNSWLKWKVEERKELLSWLGNAPPGFEYKWECSSRFEYDEVKNEVKS